MRAAYVPDMTTSHCICGFRWEALALLHTIYKNDMFVINNMCTTFAHVHSAKGVVLDCTAPLRGMQYLSFLVRVLETISEGAHEVTLV